MDNQAVPRVSVVMSVYNGEAQLGATIDSILGQTFDDFEFVIVDDGSSDRSGECLQRYAVRDPRIVLLRQPNAGLTRALIVGCEHARGEFIARQDVGDRSLPQRLEKQLEFLDQHPDVVAVGAGCRRIGPEGEFLGETIRDESPAQITRGLMEEGRGISHMVATYRADAYRSAGGYRKEFRFAQDTDLWYRMSRQGLLAELPEVLFEWGIDLDGISSTNHDRQSRLAMLARESDRRVREGGNDEEILRRAETLSWDDDVPDNRSSPRGALARAEFFIGSQLYALGDRRCRPYLMRAIRHRPFWFRPWIKAVFSYLPIRHNRRSTPA
ncbi:Putative glycosyltransferase EpsE [Stieleria maiorica]|uniref:Glycosyltransferase EpsE n=1 Tax=Stieleria maiorica TaxID=2795974 RepID=A0A5B9MH73_9BACT|nr:glycosyltransferase [Stieleria maiorica]QEF99476.1 Putative glycosyltransferase EpsE [Stieleria maiorica]